MAAGTGDSEVTPTLRAGGRRGSPRGQVGLVGDADDFGPIVTIGSDKAMLTTIIARRAPAMHHAPCFTRTIGLNIGSWVGSVGSHRPEGTGAEPRRGSLCPGRSERSHHHCPAVPS